MALAGWSTSQRIAAQAVGTSDPRAIKLNDIERTNVQLSGILTSVSTTKKAELQTEDQGRIQLQVHEQLAHALGRFFDRQVVVSAEQTTKWIINTGKEQRTFRMLGIEIGDE